MTISRVKEIQHILKSSLVILILCWNHRGTAQTLIINEVSNGPSGSQEYVELLVIDTAIAYNCNSTTPPCIDIRGWIFDDNSGYHGTNGVASGAMRFSNNTLWSCVPVGTIIVLFNDADPNPAVPAIDVSLSDGNCRLIVPISNALIETNTTTPGAVACSYPATGWTPGGNWSTTALANPGDCARIVNLAGCEVFSMCYGAANINTLIYFGGTGGQTCWYFNNGDPTLTANWSSGSASPSPGNQTPGAANNAANLSYLQQFNNGCMPITPLVATASTSTTASCLCDATATVSASGSLGGYTYNWCDASFVPIGQNTATATNLCAGTYHCIVTSGIGCEDTVTFTITGLTSTAMTVSNTTICAGQSGTLTATPVLSGGTFSWSPGGQTTASITVSPTVTTSYTCTYTLAGCTATGTGTVTVSTALPVSAGNDVTLCSGSTVQLTASGATNYTWNNGLGNGNSVLASPSTSTLYTVTGTDANGCSGTDDVLVTVVALPTVNAGQDQLICEGDATSISAIATAPFIWNNGVVDGINFTPLQTTTYTVTATDVNGCSASDEVTIVVSPLPVVDAGADQETCTGGTVVLTASGTASTYSWSNGVQNGIPFSPAATTTYQVTGTNVAGCFATDEVKVTVSTAPALQFTATPTSGCAPQVCNFVCTTIGITNVQWNFGDSSPNGSGISTQHLYASGGCFDITLTAQFGSCVLTETVYHFICLDNQPVAAFTPSQGIITEDDASVTFINSSNGAVQYSWNFGDGSTTSAEEPIHHYVFQEGQTYVVLLIATSEQGCVDTARTIIQAQNQLVFYVPNSFTPDGDEYNNVFQPIFTSGFDATDFQLLIFNRWGEIIFESNDAYFPWDGTYHNELVQEGTYTWTIEFKMLETDERKVLRGHVNVLR